MKTLIALAMLLYAAVAWANCTSYTIMGPGGKIVFCTQCCYSGNCTVTCL